MFKKYIKLSFFGQSPERFLNLCKQKQIVIWGLESDTQQYTCYMDAKEFHKIKPLARKAKVKIKILEKHGIPFILFRYRKRKLFLIGIMIALWIIFFLSRFIWNIEIIGNQSISEDVIYDYLKEKKIYHGMLKAKLDCEEICKEIRLDFYEIIWVSAALDGTSLIIEVREGKDMSISQENSEEQTDMIASFDGTVTSIVTRKGVPKVKIGDVVKAGDVLVSGVIEIKNDAGETVREDKTIADADVWIRRDISYHDSYENIKAEKIYFKTKKYRILLFFDTFSVEIGVKKQSGNQERTIQNHSLKIGKNFILPIQIGLEESKEYELKNKVCLQEDQKKILEERYQRYCDEMEKQNIQIIQEEIQFHKTDRELQLLGQMEVIQQVVDFY